MSELIYVRHPEKTATEIMKILNDFLEEEKKYEQRNEVSFRGVYLRKILAKINQN